jgi:hypothetical protein
VTREHAADGDGQRGETASSAHPVDCRLAADEREEKEGSWIRETFGR